MFRMVLLASAALTVAAQTQIDLRTQTKQVDFTSAPSTKPMKTGTTLPDTCATGEMFFKTDAPAGHNVYGCTAENTWSAQGSNLTIASGGTVVGWRPKANFTTGPGLLSLFADTGSEIDITWALDTAVIATQPGTQTGRALLCASGGNSNRTYQCSLTPTLETYTAGMVLHWIPDVSAAGGPTTLNVDTLGAVSVKLGDGVSDPIAADIVAGRLYDLWYDGTRFRLLMPTASATSGNVLSVFGRQGTILPQAGDYTTDQVMEGGNKYFTNERAQAAVNWDTLAAKPSIFAPAPHAAMHRNGGQDEIATAAPAANAIPKAGPDGKLDGGWFPANSGGLGYTAENTANKGQPNGYASLDANAKIPAAQIPNLNYAPATSGTTPLKGNGTGGTASVAAADIVGLFTGCSGTQYLGADGSCHPAGSGGSGVNAGPVIFDGTSTTLSDGSTVAWSCGTGSAAECTTNWTVPAGIHWVRVQLWSGGGQGGSTNSPGYGSAGGGGGGYHDAVCPVIPGSNVAIAVGLGGAGGTYGSERAGGSSSFGACVTVTGGAAGRNYGGLAGKLPGTTVYGWVTSTGGIPATATTGTQAGVIGWSAIRMDGGGVGAGLANTDGTAGLAGGSAIGGGGGGGSGGRISDTGGPGGTSGLGGAGGNGGGWTAAAGVTPCTAGSIPGGGGGAAGAGGTAPTTAGCAGARGEVRIYYAN